MPTDANDAWNSGFQNGISLLAQRNSSINTDLRRQQLISEDQARKFQEAQTAQHMALLMDAHNSQIEYEADMAKAGGAMALATAPTIPVEDPEGISGTVNYPNPNRLSPEDAALKFLVPTVAKHDPKAVPSLMSSIALSKYRGNALDVREQGIDAANDRNQANIDARLSAIEQRHKNELDTLAQKHQNAQDLLDLKNVQQTKIQDMRNQARLSIAQGEVSREQFLNRHLNNYMTLIQGTKAGAKLDAPALKDAALKDLGDAWDLEIGSRRSASPALPAPLTNSKVNVISPDGKPGKIPASQLDEALKAGYKRR